MVHIQLKFTGEVRTRMGVDRMDFSFEGANLRDLLDALFSQYNLRDLILAGDGSVLPYSRIVINGRFSYLVGDMDAPLQEGDMVVFIRPYVVAF